MEEGLKPQAFFTSDVVSKRNPVFFHKDDNREKEKEREETETSGTSGDCIDGYSRGTHRIGVVVRTREDSGSDSEDDYSSSYSQSNPSSEDSHRKGDDSSVGPSDASTNATKKSSNAELEPTEVEVSWFGYSSRSTALEQHDDLDLVDRPIYFSEIVSSASDSMGCTGVVTGSRMTVDLLNLEDKIIRNIDTRNICHVRSHRPGLWVLSAVGSPFLGRVEDIGEGIIVEFRDGSKCRISESKFHKIETYNDTYWAEDTMSDFEGRDCRFYPGQRVKVKDRNVLETAEWLVGGPSDHKRGIICKIEVCTLEVRWLMPIPTCSGDDVETASLPPPMDISPNDVVSLGFDEFRNTDWCIGDWCMFSKGSGEEDENGPSFSKGNDRKKKLMVVLCSHTVCDVRWQDGRLSKNIPGKDLIALKHCDDSEFWPNDFVMLRQAADSLDDSETSPRKSGVIHTVNHKDRTAVVKWQLKSKKPDEFLLGDEETVSLYALDAHPDFGHYCIGSMVILLDVERSKERSRDQERDSKVSTASIFGQIRALDNGKLHVVWADGSMSFEYPASVFCIDKDDLDSMISDYDSYSYSESYDGFSSSSGSWETVPDEENHNSNQAAIDEVLAQAEAQEKLLRDENSLARGLAQKVKLADFASGLEQKVNLAEEDGENACSESGPSHVSKERKSKKKSEGMLGKFLNVFGKGTEEGASPAAGADAKAKKDMLPRAGGGEGLRDIIGDRSEEVNYNTRKAARTASLSSIESPRAEITDTDALLKKQDFKSLLLRQTLKHEKFEVLEAAPSDHHFLDRSPRSNVPKFSKTIIKEWKILKMGLSDGVWVKCYENRMDLFRAIIVGSPGTPYYSALFSFDIYIPPDFPQVPPEVCYRSHGYRLNPNLYENGRVCLSLLNTWSGKESEKWDPKRSSILQLLVSIQGLVLVQKPYFNEAGFGKQVGTVSGEKNSVLYNENAHLLCLKLMISTLKSPPATFEKFVRDHFRTFSPVIAETMASMEAGENFSGGFKMMLSQIKPHVLAALKKGSEQPQQ
ncbi:ubiquitin-conjugating enzyme [Chloropicon primus]|uniref:Ubiquitin-conjugating enzyme n=1 Tax=Chloropicon primus TaxID=1764295 RepID=A0A5B8MMJ1_9CHLO|nr:ubiquitin-conjugating enzyme [Chloropicon primus]UPR00934.1 ubiquitin-conjugating enzyme [Chloropicon primus]|eukprot:QDZ21713.1 ubiquitin-conjugating enzyme [Chloropicon primus]